MKKELFQKIITDHLERLPLREPRDLELPINTTKIVSLIGSRRTGKTSLFYYVIGLLRESLPKENILYFNFDDDRLNDFKLEDFQLLLDSYFELFPEKKAETIYLFFDEIQNIPEWEKFIRRIYDNENCKIFLTGSSSGLLSSEIATSLRGRTITFNLFTLSFKEYLDFKKIDINVLSSTKSAVIKKVFEQYFVDGGFPELLLETDFKGKIMQEYIDMIIYKDLIERYNITNLYLIKYLVRYCFSNISTLLSLNKLFNILKSAGINVGKNTLYEYLAYLEDAMVLYQVPIYSDSPAVQQRNPKKIYAVDVGFKRAVSFEVDRGRIFENLVFIELRKKTDAIFYYKGKQEVDFLFHLDGKLQLINVSQDIDKTETYNREINGLSEAMKQLKCDTATIITEYREGNIETENGVIRIISLWKWLLKPM